MNKLYSVHDHWTDINKKNDVDIESIDGVITGIKVNGEDYGGGGSSAFIICVDSSSVDSIGLYLNDITEQAPFDITIGAGKAQVFNKPVYYVPTNQPTVIYGELINMGHVMGNPEYPEYFKIQGNLFFKIGDK